MIYILMIALCILLCISYILNKRDLVCPSFVFCASFCFSCAWAVVYAKKWDLGLHLNTFLVILGGVLEFIVISFIIQKCYSVIKGEKNIKENMELKRVEIETWKKILFLIFCIFTVLYTIYSVVHVMNGSFNDIGASIKAYYNKKLFSDELVSLPKLLNYCRYIVSAAGYWFAYIFINNYLAEKKVDVLSVLIVITSIISGLATGGRGGAVNVILACIATFCLLMNKKSGFYKSIRFKTLLMLIIPIIIIICVFQSTALLIGRKSTSSKAMSNMNFFDYLSIYCGAEIKNLDIFLQKEPTTTNKIWGSQTFIYMVRWFGPKFGIENTYYQLTLPYQKVNGFNLGNVYTTFYPYIYDFGYIGLVCLVGLMAIITQWIYEKCKRVTLRKEPVICILIYGFMFSTLVLSFFSNKFYEQNFNKRFIIIIACWIMFNIFFCRFKLKSKRNDNQKLIGDKSAKDCKSKKEVLDEQP